MLWLIAFNQSKYCAKSLVSLVNSSAPMFPLTGFPLLSSMSPARPALAGLWFWNSGFFPL